MNTLSILLLVICAVVIADPWDCKTDKECQLEVSLDSWCVMDGHHKPPFRCHAAHSPIAAPIIQACQNADIECHHAGSVDVTGCVSNEQCRGWLKDVNTYCMNFGHKQAPFVCHSDDKPRCQCSCIGQWTGPSCDVWDDKHPEKTIELLKLIADEQRDAMKQMPLHPTQAPGYTFNILDGSIGLPATEFDFNAKHLFSGNHIPDDIQVTESGHVDFDFKMLKSMNDLRNARDITALLTGKMASYDPMVYLNNPVALNKKFLSGDKSVAFGALNKRMYHLALSGIKFNKYFKKALDIMPIGNQTPNQMKLFEFFFKIWGTHIIEGGNYGQMMSNKYSLFNYHILRHKTFGPLSAHTVTEAFEIDYQLATGKDLNGHALSASAEAKLRSKLNGVYQKNREQLVEMAILPVDRSPFALLDVQLTDFTGHADAKVFASAASILVKDQQAEWASVRACTGCSVNGECRSADDEACTCTGTHTYGRKCDMCEYGWEGKGCAKPICDSQCSVHGECVAPWTCSCNECYGGKNCENYTCAAPAAPGQKPLGVVKVDNYAGGCANDLQFKFERYRALNTRVGHGISSLDGSIGLPFFEFTYHQGHKWKDFTVPDQQAFNNAGTSHTIPKLLRSISPLRDEYRNVFSSFNNQASIDLVNLKQFGDLGSAFNSYFRGATSLATTGAEKIVYTASMKNLTGMRLNRWADLAIRLLPDHYSGLIKKEIYKTFIKKWGTHIITYVESGGAITHRAAYDYSITTHNPAGHLSEAQVQDAVNRQFLGETGLDWSVNPMTEANRKAYAASVNGLFKKYSLDQGVSCFGGDIGKCRFPYNAWASSIHENPNPIRVAAVPISQFISNPTIRANVQRAIVDFQNETWNRWNAIRACPSCRNGGYCANANSDACTCRGHGYGRQCGHCEAYWAGGSCNVPQCPGCNTAGGSCVGPNNCKCKSCYGGKGCATYTCGCIAGDGMVNLANSTIPLSEVKVGDEVEAMVNGEIVYSPVFYARERNLGSNAAVYEITVKSGKTLTLTSEHLIFVSYHDEPLVLNKAHELIGEDVKAGHLVWIKNAQGELVPEEVTNVEAIKTTAPLISVDTLAGNLIVNDVAVSAYENDSFWGYLDNLEERIMYTLFPEFAKSETYKAWSNWWEDNVTDSISEAKDFLFGLFE